MALDSKFGNAILVSTGPRAEVEMHRVAEAVKRYNSLLEPACMIISGVWNDGKYLGSQSQEIYKWLIDRGVGSQNIVYERFSNHFVDKAVYVSQMIRELKDPSRPINLDISLDRLQAWRMKMLFEKARSKGHLPEDTQITVLSEGQIPSYQGKDLWKPIVSYAVDRVMDLPEPLTQADISSMVQPAL